MLSAVLDFIQGIVHFPVLTLQVGCLGSSGTARAFWWMISSGNYGLEDCRRGRFFVNG